MSASPSVAATECPRRLLPRAMSEPPHPSLMARPMRLERRGPHTSRGKQSPMTADRPPCGTNAAPLRSAAVRLCALLCAATVCPGRSHAREPIHIPPPPPAAAYVPFPNLPAPLNEFTNGIGVAHNTARARRLQAPILWVDGTANLNRINAAGKIAAVVDRANRAGFNMLVLDGRPIVGYTLYRSRHAPKLTNGSTTAPCPPNSTPWPASWIAPGPRTSGASSTGTPSARGIAMEGPRRRQSPLADGAP